MSLYNLMTEEELCPSQVDVNLPKFFRQYLSDKGTFNTPQNYSQQYGYSVGEVHIYSNIATDLAAYALANKLDTPFTALSKRYVFTPLNMHNTYWGLDTPSSDVAKRLYLDPITMQPAVYPNYRSITYADGSVISTANDLTYFLKAAMNKGKVDGKQVFSRNMVNLMLSS
ncbi:serine hydrolase domain-containing protein [Pseudoalteromonas aurantia]|uniref:serine hydrolase domain-containing protein n=1 Tax=Pseudoalteromonas aurantia TaxID=43654 RepID=UPI00110A6342|nr:serine hydrolase domain-containing protein [Pseudoalteromonas aurantia]